MSVEDSFYSVPAPDPGAAARALFAEGGAGDVLAPGPGLGALLAAAGSDCAAAGEDELAGLIAASARQVAYAQAGLAHWVLTLSQRRCQEDADGRVFSYITESATDEIGALLTLTTVSASRQREFAHGLARLPAVDDLLSRGLIDWTRAKVFVDELSLLGDDDAAAKLAEDFAGRAPGMTAGRLARALARAVLLADPEAAERRKAQGRKDARVQLGREQSGNASLSGRELPADTAIALDNFVGAAAWDLASAGVPGTLSQLRVLVYTALLSGRTVESILDDPASWPDASADGDGDLPPAPDAPPEDSEGGDPGLPDIPPDPGGDPGDPGPDGPPDDGYDAGYGDGYHAGYDAGAGKAASAAGDGSAAGAARNTKVTARRPAVINVTVPLSALEGGTEPGEVTGFGLTDAADSRAIVALLGSDPRSSWHLTVTDGQGMPLGHACSPAGPAGGQTSAAWAAGMAGQLAQFESGDCGHARRSAGYTPAPRLRHLVQVRGRTCGWGPCTRAADRCDLDHSLAYEAGGLTCECNLAALCRRHHRTKQAPGWSLEQTQPGELTWRLPSGRRYVTTGEPYPI